MARVTLGKDTSGRPLVVDDTWLAKLRWAEHRLGYTFTIIQGSYRAGSGAVLSGGTHDAGGAGDLRTWDLPASLPVTAVLTALRHAGLIAWHRHQSVFPDHEIHALDYGNPGLSPSAASQVVAWQHGRNGLTGSLEGPDDGPRVTIPKEVPPMTTQATTFGIDVSNYQSSLDLTKAAAQGYAFVVIKCTQGTGYVSPSYSKQVANAKTAKLLTGVYHFLERGNATGQATNLAAHIGDKTLPVFIDVEPYNTSRPTATDWVAFRDACTHLGLKVVGKYLNENYWGSIGRPSLVGPLALWRAAYPSSVHDYGSRLYPGNTHAYWNPFGGQTPVLWQFASTGKLDGYSGNVDVNAFRGTRAELAATGLFKDYTTAAPVKPKQPAPPAKPPAPKPVVKRLDPLTVPVDPTVLTLSVVVANIKCDPQMPQADVEADVAAIKGLPTPGASPMWFGSEIEIPRYTQAWTDQLNCLTLCDSGECPITLRKIHWNVLGEAVHVLHGGMAGVSPERVLSVVRATHVQHPTIKIAAAAKHMVSGAWSNTYPATKAWRLAHWNEDFTETAAAFQRLIDDGYTVVVGGDYNRAPMLPFLPGQVRMFANGVQYIDVIPAAGYDVKLLGAKATKPGDLHTDHPAIVATFTITPTAPPEPPTPSAPTAPC